MKGIIVHAVINEKRKLDQRTLDAVVAGYNTATGGGRFRGLRNFAIITEKYCKILKYYFPKPK